MPRKEREARARAASAPSMVGNLDGFAGTTASTHPDSARLTPHQAIKGGTARCIEYLLRRDDGWLRAIPSRDGSPCYLKWKFTHGRWANHYVMSVAQYWQQDYLFALLVDKLEHVDRGELKPSRDALHNGYQEGDNNEAANA